jgi:hypothetical protein
MKTLRHRPTMPAQASLPVSTSAAANEPPPAHATTEAPVTRAVCENRGGALPVPVLERLLGAGRKTLADLQDRPLPLTLDALVDTYAALGKVVSDAEAALLSALDALDPRTGGGTAHPQLPYQRVWSGAFELLRNAGTEFARLEAAFGTLVHGGEAWPGRPVAVKADRGDGRPVYEYENTFRKSTALTVDEKRKEYASRVKGYLDKGGRFEDIIVAKPGVFDTLQSGLRYDYVLSAGGVMRMYPNERDDADGPAKPGHSLLAVGGPDFKDVRALLAGEIWVLKDSAGDVEAVIIANNSGHFKPAFADLQNSVPFLCELGIPEEKVVLLGGPNNLLAMFSEIEKKHGLTGLSEKLPRSAADTLRTLTEAPTGKALNVRAGLET